MEGLSWLHIGIKHEKKESSRQRRNVLLADGVGKARHAK